MIGAGVDLGCRPIVMNQCSALLAKYIMHSKDLCCCVVTSLPMLQSNTVRYSDLFECVAFQDSRIVKCAWSINAIMSVRWRRGTSSSRSESVSFSMLSLRSSPNRYPVLII